MCCTPQGYPTADAYAGQPCYTALRKSDIQCAEKAFDGAGAAIRPEPRSDRSDRGVRLPAQPPRCGRVGGVRVARPLQVARGRLRSPPQVRRAQQPVDVSDDGDPAPLFPVPRAALGEVAPLGRGKAPRREGYYGGADADGRRLHAVEDDPVPDDVQRAAVPARGDRGALPAAAVAPAAPGARDRQLDP